MEKSNRKSTTASHLAGFYGVLMILLGVGGLFAIRKGMVIGYTWHKVSVLLFWGMTIAGLLHYAYRENDHDLFGKTADGRVSPLYSIVMLPYLALLWARQIAITVFGRENKYDKICDGVWAGRRPTHASHLPEGVAVCVDLAAEFPRAKFLRDPSNGIKYVSFPILEASTRDCDALRDCIDSLPEGAVYIHCAQGHGRTGFFTAAYLLRRGRVETLPQAEGMLTAARPGIKLRKAQREYLLNHCDRVRS